MTALENWNTWRLDRYAEALERGDHDTDCEQRERFGLCHCHKRARLRAGRTTPPEFVLMYPLCGDCDTDLNTDGDAWTCESCGARWPMSVGDGDRGEWIDDHGADVLGGPEWGRRLHDLVHKEVAP